MSMDGRCNVGKMFVNTVHENYEGYTKQWIHKVMEARKLQMMMGNPLHEDFVEAVSEKLLPNCPVTVSDTNTVKIIYGPDLTGVMGEIIRKGPKHVQPSYMSIPRDFMELHKYVSLVADVMFVNGLPFFMTKSRGISLVSIKYCVTRTALNLARLIQ